MNSFDRSKVQADAFTAGVIYGGLVVGLAVFFLDLILRH